MIVLNTGYEVLIIAPLAPAADQPLARCNPAQLPHESVGGQQVFERHKGGRIDDSIFRDSTIICLLKMLHSFLEYFFQAII